MNKQHKLISGLISPEMDNVSLRFTGCWSTRTFTNSYFGQLVPKNSYFTFPWSTRTLCLWSTRTF